MEPISILQLEDSELDAQFNVTCLERAGLAVKSKRVQHRAEFEAALNGESFDLILADFKMPGFDGLEGLAIARQKVPNTPFIIVSGKLGEENAIDSLHKGATDYVLKMRMERLVPAVQRALSEARERAERRRVESALAETEKRFRNMADSAPVMIWTAGVDRIWNYCNRLWLQFTHMSAEQICGEGWKEVLHPDDRAYVLEVYHLSFENRMEFTLEYRFRRADGEYRWIVNRAVPRLDDKGEFAGFIGSCTDITEVKQAEERVLHAAKLESLGILAGGIAHDFNNLLTGILGHASLLLDESTLSSRGAESAEAIVQASETAARLTRQMLAYAGKGSFVLTQVDISLEVQNTIPLIEASVPRLVEIRLDLARRLPKIWADPTQIQQIIMNLVINAAESIGTGAGSVVVSTGTEHLDDAAVASLQIAPGRYVVLRVTDTGHGMDEKTKARIFDPFFTTKFTGRGLGLAAVSGIVRSCQGGIALVSKPGEGTDFRVYLPPHQAPSTGKPDGEAHRAAAGKGTVLVVDDEPVVLRAAGLMLEQLGYTVLMAGNGQEAIDLFRSRPATIDVVLLDMTMPVMPGEITFQKIRAIRANAKVIVSSGFDKTEALRRFGPDIDGFLQKPYQVSRLGEIMSGVLEV
ncbi:MAG: response regulator [Acidobacteriota bacterium]|nr:response regulator [Acidobacteriota bacterium]